MPVIFNEPLSFLQRLTEYMEHTYLIHQANTISDSVERMKVGSGDMCYVFRYQHNLTALSLELMRICVCSVWLRLLCPLWLLSGNGQENPLTLYWEKPTN